MFRVRSIESYTSSRSFCDVHSQLWFLYPNSSERKNLMPSWSFSLLDMLWTKNESLLCTETEATSSNRLPSMQMKCSPFLKSYVLTDYRLLSSYNHSFGGLELQRPWKGWLHRHPHGHAIAIWVLDILIKHTTSCQVPHDHMIIFEVFSAGFFPRKAMGKSAGKVAICCHLPRGLPLISRAWLKELPAEGSQIPLRGYRNNLHSCILRNEFPSAYGGDLNSFGEVQKQTQILKICTTFLHPTKGVPFRTWREQSWILQQATLSASPQREPKSKQSAARRCSKVKNVACLRQAEEALEEPMQATHKCIFAQILFQFRSGGFSVPEPRFPTSPPLLKHPTLLIWEAVHLTSYKIT